MKTSDYFEEKINNECNGCFMKENGECQGSVVCYGGHPIFPPCSELNDDELEMDIEDYKEQIDIQIENEAKRREEIEAEKERLKIKRDKANKKRKQTKKDMKFFYDVEKIIKLSIRKNLGFLNSLEMAKTFSSFNKDLSHSNINSKLDEKRDIEIAKFNQQNKTLFECLRYLKQFKKDFLKEYHKMESRDEFKALEEKWLEILHKELKSRLGEK